MEKLWTLMACFAAAGGCGGKVVFDQGSGGATSTGSTTNAVGATATKSAGTVSPSGSTTSGAVGPGEPACSNKCAAQAQVGCPAPPGCDASCESVFANPKHGCNAALAQYYACFAANPTAGCGVSQGCSQAIKDYFQCVDSKCSMSQLSAAGGVVVAKGECGGHTVVSTCNAGVCSCEVDGASAGMCSDGSLDFAVGFDETCCTSFYPG